MVIDLQRALILNCQKKQKIFNLFKGSFNFSLPYNVRVSNLTRNADTIIQYTLKSSIQAIFPFLPVSLRISTRKQRIAVPKSGKTPGVKKAFKEKTVEVLQDGKLAYNYACAWLTFSKLFFPHKCINIFVHFSEKTNLLFRSGNKTEFSAGKILQTTTI